MAEQEAKIIVVIGAPGSGKSSLCNVISGRIHNDNKVFPVSSSMESCTGVTKQSSELWQGKDFNITVIDTPGLNDSHGDNAKNILQIAQILSDLKYVDLFLIVVQKGTVISAALVELIRVFKLCFGTKFLEENTVIEVSKWAHNKEEKQRNEETEESFHEKINAEMKK